MEAVIDMLGRKRAEEGWRKVKVSQSCVSFVTVFIWKEWKLLKVLSRNIFGSASAAGLAAVHTSISTAEHFFWTM